MPTYSKETALYDTGTIAAGIDAAGNTADTYITAVGQDGIKVHAANNVGTNYAGIDATGMDVVKGGTSVAKFGETTRIGKAFVSGAGNNESHMELDYHSLQLVDKEGNAYLYVSDLRGSDGSMLVEWESELTYVQALGTASMDLLLPPTTYQTSIITENIVSVVAHTPSGDVDITNYVNASSSSASELVFTSLPTLGTFTRATATATYHTSDRRVKALTYGSRKTPEDIGVCSSVLGWENDASGLFSHAHGNGCVASGVASNAEGGETEAVADYSHAEGRSSGTGKYAYCGHAEGCNTHANAHSAHSEGYRTTASGEHAHAEGIDSTASGNSSHAEGNNTSATKPYAHAEGRATQATFDEAHAQNLGTIAAKRAQTAIGTFNVEDTSSGTTHPSGDSNAGEYALIIGNGTSGNARSNALAVNWNGSIESGIAEKGAIQWINAARGTAAVYVPKKEGDMSNVVASLVMETAGGGAWIISNYADEYLRLSYVTGADRSSSNNNAVHPIVLHQDGTVAHLGDVGWTNLPLGSAVEAYSSGQTPQYRKVGQVVNLVGACKNKAQLAANGSLTLGTLPAGCRPHHDVVVLCQGSSQNKWCVAANASGTVIASRYSTGGTLVAASAGTWIPFNITFLV